MKKLITVILALSIILSISAFGLSAFAEEGSDGFAYNEDGVILGYSEESALVLDVPDSIFGTTITEIGKDAFSGLDISTVYIADGIEIIGENAFAGSNVEYVDIPESAKLVKKGAFANCGGLGTVVLNSPDVKFEAGAFANTDRLHISIMCSMDEASVSSKIAAAKGDDNFEIHIMHCALVEDLTEKDAFGKPVMYCETCGFRGSTTYDETYIPFKDVSKSAWYFPYVSIAYFYEIIKGKTPELFCPDDNLTLAETCKIAACLNKQFAKREGEAFAAKPNEPWYMPYVEYCEKYGITESGITFDWNKKATRAQVAYFFSRCYDFDECILNPDVPLTDIPDVNEKTLFSYYILDLYRRGIATGSDESYTFHPDSYIKRSEVATLITRILRDDLRKELPKG